MKGSSITDLQYDLRRNVSWNKFTQQDSTTIVRRSFKTTHLVTTRKYAHDALYDNHTWELKPELEFDAPRMNAVNRKHEVSEHEGPRNGESRTRNRLKVFRDPGRSKTILKVVERGQFVIPRDNLVHVLHMRGCVSTAHVNGYIIGSPSRE